MSKITAAYETVMVLSTKLSEDDTAALVNKFKTLIEQNGTIDAVNEWGKRRLAYPINYETDGYYYLIDFTCDSQFPAELDRVYKITDGVLRTIIVKKGE